MGNYMVTTQEISFYSKGLWEAYTAGHIKEMISREYPFTAEGVAQAHIDLAGRKTTGKLVVKIAE
jgi:NADPH2:quinone reductase